MAFHLLRIYFRAGVLVPFYLSIALALMFVVPRLSFLGFSLQAAAEDSTVHGALQIPFLSGIIGLCTLSAFLNRVPKIANHLLYSLLSWMLLPYACIAYLLCTQLDWSVMNRPGTTAMVMACLFLIVCFFHVIGIVISYTDFRATVLKNRLEQGQEEAQLQPNVLPQLDQRKR